jgi:hypothetical protein
VTDTVRGLTSADLLPGDILVVADKKWPSFFIKLRALVKGESSLHNHVAVISHRDEAGTLWAVEGRPSGTGWVDADIYLKAKFTKTNAGLDMHRTDDERKKVVEIIQGLVGTKYDWSAIVELGMDAIDAGRLWHAKEFGADEVPAHIICSALAAWAYKSAGWRRPHELMRFTTPGQWYDFIAELELEPV